MLNYLLTNFGSIKGDPFLGVAMSKSGVAQGKAKLPDKGQPGKLKVSFFWIFYADYYILDLDPDYQWVLIGSSSDNYLWILSRKPQMSDELYQQLTEKLKTRGYDLAKLEKVLQPGE